MPHPRNVARASLLALSICVAWQLSAEVGVAATCGDGVITTGETCDDGNAVGGDCCSAACQFEPNGAACLDAVEVAPSGSFAGAFQDQTAGWEFRVNAALTVTALGVFDCNDNGLAEGHEVGLFDKAGPTLLATATVPPGTAADLVAHFRGIPIPALPLVAGHTYVIAALYPKTGTDCVVDDGDFHFDPRITFVTGRQTFSPTGGFHYPTDVVGDRFGPTFLFESRRGNGVIDSGEQCDDGNVASGDGCSADGAIESGYACVAAPSSCAPICGDGKIVGGETCDDGDAAPGDGCSSACKIELDYTCRGAPSVCTNTCGNGVVDGGEFCDDGNRANDDGCSALCAVEDSFACVGNPSVCTSHCGDFVIGPLEQCDDGNLRQGDCCSKNCRFLPGNVSCRKSMTVPAGGGGGGGTGVVEGWEFTVSSPVILSGLGVYDDPESTGLAETHPVAIWLTSQQMLRNGTVPAGTTAELVDGFRYVPVGGLTLQPGNFYVVGAFFPEPRNDRVIGSATLPLDPRIQLVRGRREPFVNSLVFPNSLGSSPQIGAAFLLSFVGCGNATLDAGEECDDGNLTDGDCCSSTCVITSGPACMAGDACLGDCNHDGQLRAGDLFKIAAIVNGCAACAAGTGVDPAGCAAVPGADKQCAAGDFDHDGCLSAGELTRAIAHLMADPVNGCPEGEEECPACP